MQSYVSVDPLEIGRMAMDFWKYELTRYREARRTMGQKLNILDIPYRQVLEDPLNVVDMIYRRAGISLTPDARHCILRWIENNPQDKHGKNTYTLERYGLSAKAVRSALGVI